MGDAPVAYARWRLDTAPDGSGSNHSVAVLDRLCVLGNYRTQNVARNMLNFVMQVSVTRNHTPYTIHHAPYTIHHTPYTTPPPTY